MKEAIKHAYKPIYNQEQIYYYRIYSFFVKNKFVSYSKFIKSVCILLNIKPTSINEINRMINYVKKYVSNRLGEEMQLILEYKIATKEKDRVNSLILYSKIMNIELVPMNEVEYIIKRSPIDNMKVSSTIQEKAKKSKERRKKEIDLVIEENKTIDDLIQEGKLKSKSIYTEIIHSINEIEADKYVKFVCANSQLKSISCAELDQYIEVLNYFCDNLDKNVKKFDSLTTVEEIINFHVSGEENLKGKYKEELSILKKWKKDKILARQEHYHALRDLMVKFRENLDFNEFNDLSEKAKRNITEDLECIYNYYNDVIRVVREYRRICKMNYASNSKKKEIKEEFNKQLILRDNE